ncbi:type II secretion system protein M [Novosphingobium sp. KCTC 2891]|uniref:type II secretion system protein M n=1 Tax=Novosphingobium sp. KCTC 2891 TaxID=2989730 RepID=UPI00222393BE|nr:type II secretion system protein M [Novosphingobium sp. KCTC 2891]MCW1384032.1 type II secretion system protein M [Novosphingobium sp. KCTC 2891]
MRALLDWRAGLTGRERRLVDLAALLTALVVGVYGIVLPVGHALDDAEARHAAAVERSARLVTAVRSMTPGVSPRESASAPLDQIVSVSAQEAGLVVQSVQPRGSDRVVLVIPSAPPVTALGWIDRLGARGLAVESLAVRPSPDGTAAVEVTFRRAGP